MMENHPPKILGKIGFSEALYMFLILVIGLSMIYFQVSGIGNPPKVRLISTVKDNNIIIKVIEGSVPRSDWQYIVYNVDTNPPIIWIQSNSPLETGREIVLASNLPPGTYKIIIMHKPSQRIIYEAKVKIG